VAVPVDPDVAADPELTEDVLRSDEAGPRVVRGGVQRAIGYLIGIALVAAASVVLLRHLGVVEFGKYTVVMSLIGIVSGVTDAGLTAVGNRELAIRPDLASRRRLMQSLLGMRLILTPIGVLFAVAFAVIAGYESAMVVGTLLAGAGLVLVNTQATIVLPLSVELKNVRVTVNDVFKNVITTSGIAVLAAAGASLLPFFTVQIAVGILALAIAPALVGTAWLVAPRFDRESWRMLFREALPIAIALALNLVYFRVLVVITSLVASSVETGLVGTSFRITEMLIGIPTLVLSVALPVLSAAGVHDHGRLKYVLQRMVEVGALTGMYLAVMIVILASPAIELIGGEQYADAAGILQIQGFALIGVFLGQVCQLGLIAIRRQRAMAWANGVALVAVIVLGLILLPAVGAEGAGIAAVLAEGLLATTLFVFLRIAKRDVAPSFAFAWKIVACGAVAVAAYWLPLNEWVNAVIGTLAFGAAALLVRAIPSEMLELVPFRRG
jgi:O-antigen/teichoic acid export membrane protein